MPTRFCFLGLILGTLPMVWSEVKKEGFSKGYYVVILLAAAVGTRVFTWNAGGFPQVTDPSLLQCILLGIAVAATAIVPGVDPAVFLSSLGFYEMYVGALASLNLDILIPMVFGLAVGAVGISFAMSVLFQRFYTASFSVIFGIFLSMIPNMLTADCILRADLQSVISLFLTAAGFLLSLYLGDFRRFNNKLSALSERFRKRG